MQAHPARARLPRRPGAVAAQAGQFLPVLPAVGRAEQPGVLDPGVDRVGVVRRRFQVPDPGELPRVRRAVVPLVRPGGAVVAELVADRRPGAAAVVGALDDLAEPAAGLRGVQPVRVGRRPLDVVDLPAREVRPAHVPLLPLAVRAQHERALARPDQHPYTAHSVPSSGFYSTAILTARRPESHRPLSSALTTGTGRRWRSRARRPCGGSAPRAGVPGSARQCRRRQAADAQRDAGGPGRCDQRRAGGWTRS